MMRKLFLVALVFVFASMAVVAAPKSKLPKPATEDMFYPRDSAKEELGRLLFFDKILSGNMNTSCATCHHPFAWTADSLSLSIGEGGTGVGPTRDTGNGTDAVLERVPRNAPHIFNLGAKEFTRMFHDGRVEADLTQPSGFKSPAGADLPVGLDHALAVQAMFPVTSATEMAGQTGENPIADAAAIGDLAGPVGVWAQLAERLQAIPEYVDLFRDAFVDVNSATDITFVHAANAIGAFEAGFWRADDSPFDQYLRGNHQTMSVSQKQGMHLFYGKANCSSCHSGTFQTDHQFYAVGMPQIGPGKGDNLPGYVDGLDDFGRERVTLEEEDRFRFRTPTLRNVVLTGPWGHDGAYNDLEAMVRHLLNPKVALENYEPDQTVLPSRADLDAIDFLCFEDSTRREAIADAVEIHPVALTDSEVEDVLAFLHALTDRRSVVLRKDVPERVPSGLSLAE